MNYCGTWCFKKGNKKFNHTRLFLDTINRYGTDIRLTTVITVVTRRKKTGLAWDFIFMLFDLNQTYWLIATNN